MKNSQKRTCCDISYIHQDHFQDFCRNGNQAFFTRNRKMPLHDLLFTMINRSGITLGLELRNYMKNEDISKNLVPIRPDRHYHRTKGQLVGKYSNTHKRAY